jgi:hypothetical protein
MVAIAGRGEGKLGRKFYACGASSDRLAEKTLPWVEFPFPGADHADSDCRFVVDREAAFHSSISE